MSPTLRHANGDIGQRINGSARPLPTATHWKTAHSCILEQTGPMLQRKRHAEMTLTY